LLSLVRALKTPVTPRLRRKPARFISFVLTLVAVLLLVTNAPLLAQSLTVLHIFSGKDGQSPNDNLFRDSASNLYGTTAYGGKYGFGTLFKLDKSGHFTVLYSFAGSPSDGAYPNGGLVRDKAGNFYGTTSQGGATNGGSVFKFDTTGKETVLYSFIANSSDGMWPYAELIRDATGNLYGTASANGAFGGGTVFKIDSSGKETVLHNFSGNSTDGMWPEAGLRLSGGRLYGTTAFGGTSNLGTIFVLHKSAETVAFNFAGTAGEFPFSSFVKDSSGNFYGTTEFGGDMTCNAPSSGCGTVYKLDASGNHTVLYSFLGSPDGDAPIAGVIVDKSGNLYGATPYGGTGSCQNSPFMGCGTIFKLDQTGKETVLFNFTGGADGKYPFGTLIRDVKGNLYGSTAQGGTGCGGSGCGTLFKLTP
jgi:uncharacterized repeat protein (TIGR03803 family)